MIRFLSLRTRCWSATAAVLFLVGCTESRQIWPPFCQTQALDGPGRLAGHHFVAQDPWPLTTGSYDYLDYLGLDEQGRARIRTTSGDITAVGFIGGAGAGTANFDTLRFEPGAGPQAVHEKICIDALSTTPDGAGGFKFSYRLTQRGPDGACRPCATPQ